jgi:heme/copper-type cytochrome/quinol oxidase subunit 2
LKKILSFVPFLLLPVLAAAGLIGCTTEDAAVGAAAGLAGIWIFFMVLIWLVVAGAGIFFFVIWLIALIDCARRDSKDFPDATENSKLIWILVIVLAGGIGAIIYYFIVMRKQPRKK